MGRLFGRLFAAVGLAVKRLFNRGVRLKFVLGMLLLFIGGAVAMTYSLMINNVGGKDNYEEAMRYVELKHIVEDNYIDPVDPVSMTDSSSAAIVSGLGDKWSYYMTSDEYKSYQLYAANDSSDIGMSMLKDDSGTFEIVSVTPGTPAFNAGLAVGMRIKEIDGTDVRNLDIDGLRTLIRSKLNVPFTVTADRNTYTVDCTANYSTSVSYRLEKTEAGYIQVKNFQAGTGNDVINAIEDLLANKAVALVLDLRNNGGGLSEEAAILLDYLLPNGDLFSIVDKGGHMETIHSDAMSLQLPMVVLVNGETYAEAEVVAAVLQEYGWATIMGETTKGMTRMQENFELDDGSAVRLSTKSYITPNGVDLSAVGGVIPEMIIYNADPNTVGTTEGTVGDSDGSASSSDDTQLMQALKLLS